MRAFLLAVIGGGALLFAGLFLLDPYDRYGFGLANGLVTESGPRTAQAGRARSLAFDGAIFGNSHIQLLSPERLEAATGLKLVQLTVPGTGPTEQLVLLDYYLATPRPAPMALVLGLDDGWCGASIPPLSNPFPFWLYDRTLPGYLSGLFRFEAVEVALRRLRIAISGRGAERPDGYWDFEARVQRRPGDLERGIAALQAAWGSGNTSAAFPALDDLERRWQRIPPGWRVVMVVPPIHAAALPPPDSPAGQQRAACTQRLARLAASGPGRGLVDARVDTPLTRTDSNFRDVTHYGHEVARFVEERVAESLRSMGSRPAYSRKGG